ncbi:MAG: carbohydrate porin [Burkholderiaceae bacterium]|nr:MAG: carbohydrate porin [Burkholderiaceae bacterium]
MLKRTVLTATLAAAFGMPAAHVAAATSDPELAQIREQIQQLKESYERRIAALEQRLQESEAKAQAAPAVEVTAITPAVPSSASAAANGFNPSVALILGGTYAHLSQDPAQYRLQGFLPSGDEIGPGKRSFNLGESELTLSANIDPDFAGRLTFSLAADNSVSVEEAFVQTLGLSHGVNVKAGRFLSGIGYLNSQHAHAWDFVDAPLAYQAFFGGQYKPDGVQLTWLAPTERFLEVGLEAGNGSAFPGNDRSKNGFGATTLFAHVGDDLGVSASWRAGVSYLRTNASNRSYTDSDHLGVDVTNAFTDRSDVWIVDGIYKWAPNGNAAQTSFKLQGEYFRRKETGTLFYDTQAQSLGSSSAPSLNTQSGWYVQGVYQFMPKWRSGLRYDRLDSGSLALNGLNPGDFARLSEYHPTRASWMLDYSPSEFSRLRLQLARDRSRPDAIDNQLFLQYLMSLGTHGAHTF